MNFPGAYNQIQNWPTPQPWAGVKHGIRTVVDTHNVNLALSTFIIFIPVDESVTELNSNSAVALTLWNNGGPAGDHTLTDDTANNIALSTFINYIAVDESVTDTANGNIALSLWSNNTPTDRSVQDDSNSFLALTKWTQ